MKFYVHCNLVGEVLVPIYWQSEFDSPKGLPSKIGDMVTGLIEIDKKDIIAFYSEYTGQNIDGDTSGEIQTRYYFHTDNQGDIVAYTPYMKNGVVYDEPTKTGAFITTGIPMKNADKRNGMKINGNRQDRAGGRIDHH